MPSLFRGGLYVLDDNTLYAAFSSNLVRVDSVGNSTPFAALSGTGKIWMARNNAATPDIVVVLDPLDAAGPYEFELGSALISYADSDVSYGGFRPTCMTFHDGYFMFGYANGNIRASGLQATSINTLDVANAASNPDGVVEIWSWQGNLYVAGTSTVEVWGYPVNAAGFPLTRQGYHVTPGIIGHHTVAGFAPEFGYPPIYVGSDNTVRQIAGLEGKKISLPDLDRLIDALDDKSELEAMAYRASGHAFWQLSCNDWTWVFCLDNGTWHERQSTNQTRSRFNGGSVYAFNKWLTGSNINSDLLEISSETQQEADDDLPVTIESVPVIDFPNRIRVARADFDFVTGVGNALVADPSVDISWSDDGGLTYSNPLNRDLGQSGESTKRVTVVNTGLSGPMGRKWRLYVSDPVDFALIGGDQMAEIRRK